MDRIRAVVLDAARAITPLLAHERVAERWTAPSALEQLTVGGLAGHLVRALETIELYLDEPEPPDEGLLTPATYFAAALTPTVDLSSPIHIGIRERGEAAGAVGRDLLLAEHEQRFDRLAQRFASEPATRRVTVLRGAARMTLDQYLPTRLVEIVIHADDLAVSADIAPPPFDEEVLGIVIDVLVGTARVQHGDAAVIRALARRERDAVSALRVL